MCILVSASDQATAAPEAPAPTIRTSTGSFIPACPPCPRRFPDDLAPSNCLQHQTIGVERLASKGALRECRTSQSADHWCCHLRMLDNWAKSKIDSENVCPSKIPLPPPAPPRSLCFSLYSDAWSRPAQATL